VPSCLKDIPAQPLDDSSELGNQLTELSNSLLQEKPKTPQLEAQLREARERQALAARAQRPAFPVIGYLSFGSPAPNAEAEFRRRLKEAGYDDGRNVAIEFRWASNQGVRIQELAADLVRRQVAVIVTMDGAATDAAKAATSTIPIVFVTAADPVSYGYATSLSRPGGNMTGAGMLSTALVGKQLNLLREMVPRATTFGYLTLPGQRAEETTRNIVAAARAMNQYLVIAEARTASDIESAIATLVQRGNGALIVSSYLLFATNMNRILELGARHNIPAIYPHSGWVRRGGLMSYAAKAGTVYKVVADYVVRILQGAKPADLPVQQPAEFDFVINLKTAKALGLTVPPTLYTFATEVIE
jgi:putative ABC transport system substrate-binding protein